MCKNFKSIIKKRKKEILIELDDLREKSIIIQDNSRHLSRLLASRSTAYLISLILEMARVFS